MVVSGFICSIEIEIEDGIAALTYISKTALFRIANKLLFIYASQMFGDFEQTNLCIYSRVPHNRSGKEQDLMLKIELVTHNML